MQLSYWEYKTWFTNVDFTIVGSGIVGLCCALSLKEKYPKSKVLVLERGSLPYGASSRNAGFACFGSISEVLSDLKRHSEEEVLQLVRYRWEGIQMLRGILGDKTLAYERNGGHEVFLEKNSNSYETCLDKIPYVNELLEPVFGKKVFASSKNTFGFENVNDHYITHSEEGQIDTGQMMMGLLNRCTAKGVVIMNGMEVRHLQEETKGVRLVFEDVEFISKKVLVATNGFASQLLKNKNVKPARAQVLITKPICDLRVKGTFHLDEGYYYFRNVDNRILLGGGRNLDFQGEETTEMKETPQIQNELERLLFTIILPKTAVTIEHRWSGIMGVGPQKVPIVEQISPKILCGVRLGGMGVAIGSLVGKKLAELAL